MREPQFTRKVHVADLEPDTSYALKPGEAAHWNGCTVVQRDDRYEVWERHWFSGWHLDEVCYGGQWTLHSEALPVVPERPEPVLDKLAWRAERERADDWLFCEDRDPKTRGASC